MDLNARVNIVGYNVADFLFIDVFHAFPFIHYLEL